MSVERRLDPLHRLGRVDLLGRIDRLRLLASLHRLRCLGRLDSLVAFALLDSFSQGIMRRPRRGVLNDAAVVLRNDVVVEDPLPVVLGFVEAWRLDTDDRLPPESFGEMDLRLANRDGARISALEMAAVLERRPTIERALRAIASESSLVAADHAVPWQPLSQLYGAFAGIRGVRLSKASKALHRKRPALIPMLDSVVQGYLADHDPGKHAQFGERALALIRGYKRDLDRNRRALRTLRRELEQRGHMLTEVRIIDLLIWADQVSPPQRKAPDG